MEKFLKILVVLFLILPLYGQNWDTYTFEELEDLAISTLENIGVTCWDFHFVTDDGFILVDKYEKELGITKKNGFMLGSEYKGKNGTVSIYADFIPPDPEEKLIFYNRAKEMTIAMAIAAAISSRTSWSFDILYFRMNEKKKYWITTKNCIIASRIDKDKDIANYIINNLNEVRGALEVFISNFELYFSVAFFLVYIILWILFSFKILARAGFAPALAFLSFIPILNLIFLVLLITSVIRILKEYQRPLVWLLVIFIPLFNLYFLGLLAFYKWPQEKLVLKKIKS